MLSFVPLLPAAWVLFHGADLELQVRPPVTDAVRAVELMDRELPGRPPTIGLVFGHPTQSVT